MVQTRWKKQTKALDDDLEITKECGVLHVKLPIHTIKQYIFEIRQAFTQGVSDHKLYALDIAICRPTQKAVSSTGQELEQGKLAFEQLFLV